MWRAGVLRHLGRFGLWALCALGGRAPFGILGGLISVQMQSAGGARLLSIFLGLLSVSTGDTWKLATFKLLICSISAHELGDCVSIFSTVRSMYIRKVRSISCIGWAGVVWSSSRLDVRAWGGVVVIFLAVQHLCIRRVGGWTSSKLLDGWISVVWSLCTGPNGAF